VAKKSGNQVDSEVFHGYLGCFVRKSGFNQKEQVIFYTLLK